MTVQIRGIFGMAIVSLLCSVATVQAQTADSTLYIKAQQMVSDGDAVAGRALVDSLLGKATVGTPQYGEALYWRAILAASASDAERGYRQIVVDYPLSPRVDDALLRMGQLELTRGDREAALQHFQRLTLEHPGSPLRAKASYWTARALFEKNDITHACAANADALSHVRSSDVELRNQIDFQNQRCRDVAASTAAAVPAPVAAEPVVPAAAEKAVAKKPAVAKVAPKAVAAKPATTKAVAAKPASVSAKPAKDTSTHPTPAAEEVPVVSDTSASTQTVTATGKFSVQVAAYYDRTQADALATKLRTRGYLVHVDGTKAPFRVRIGHYDTHAKAATALANMKAKHIDGFVAQE